VGNSSDRRNGVVRDILYPATIAGVIAVGAINRNGEITNYSNEALGARPIDVVAPSGHDTGACVGEVVTTDRPGTRGCNDGPNGGVNDFTQSFSGTSAAAPQVSAVAALLITREPDLTAAQVKTRILDSADPWGAPTRQFGRGKLNAYRTLLTPLSVTITGPTTIKTPGTYTWTANASGGSSYTYRWEASENGGAWYWVGSGSTYSRYIDSSSPSTIDLRVTVTSGERQGVDTHRVNNLILPP
jgi:subtilisin family serine protease